MLPVFVVVNADMQNVVASCRSLCVVLFNQTGELSVALICIVLKIRYSARCNVRENSRSPPGRLRNVPLLAIWTWRLVTHSETVKMRGAESVQYVDVFRKVLTGLFCCMFA